MTTCKRLQGRVTLITGGASGIGAATARRVAAEGGTAVVADIQDEMGKNLVASIESDEGKARYLHLDVTDEDNWTGVIQDILDHEGEIWGLVNNAGIGVGGPFTECTLEEWRHIFSINVEGVFLGCKHASAPMVKGGGGSIVNISSIAGLQGAANLSAYCATKGAVRLYTKAVAMELAQALTGVRCNSVHPGIIDTPIWDEDKLGGDLNECMQEQLVEQGLAQPGSNVPILEVISQIVPGGKGGTAEDIAAGIAFLLSDDAAHMTGSELVIDHGITAS